MSKTTLAGFVAVLFSGLGLALAQTSQQVPQQDQPQLQQQQQQKYRANFRGESDVSHKPETHRASEIIGMNIDSSKNESIGEVEDLVLDPSSGKVRYAAISVGGFLGIGDKLVAVPWQSLEFKENSDGDTRLTLDTTREKLKTAPGFKEDNWPNFADQNWSRENDRHYGVDTSVRSNR